MRLIEVNGNSALADEYISEEDSRNSILIFEYISEDEQETNMNHDFLVDEFTKNPGKEYIFVGDYSGEIIKKYIIDFLKYDSDHVTINKRMYNKIPVECFKDLGRKFLEEHDVLSIIGNDDNEVDRAYELLKYLPQVNSKIENISKHNKKITGIVESKPCVVNIYYGRKSKADNPLISISLTGDVIIDAVIEEDGDENYADKLFLNNRWWKKVVETNEELRYIAEEPNKSDVFMEFSQFVKLCKKLHKISEEDIEEAKSITLFRDNYIIFPYVDEEIIIEALRKLNESRNFLYCISDPLRVSAWGGHKEVLLTAESKNDLNTEGEELWVRPYLYILKSSYDSLIKDPSVITENNEE